ncbi:uncharacterized protein C8Q71DRAFT_323383 [Rhodofomes roseus]|uniref:Leucine rich repeat (LRR) protein n=1 Tax=Rhodofomes roseus TaxID=34475 RepID=A0ABQ8K260_9APHY|nr:uncharacterized protein C8Q71DRAFT_323383 [Rhodofomes roseus]KAH9830817.1 hypothetical protein C8Q71DRAFT_323383 [Rhodofomes roseus]
MTTRIVARRALRLPLLSDDIIHAIVEQICMQIKDETDKRRSLVQLAYTCKTFSRHALPELWAHLPSLRPLLSLLAPLRSTRLRSVEPEDEQYDLYIDDESCSWVFDSAITPIGTSRFREYAGRVRELDIRRYPQFESSVFTCIDDAGLHGPLLPALRVLLCETSPIMMTAVEAVCGPSLRSFAVVPSETPSMQSSSAESRRGLEARDPDLDSLLIRFQSSLPDLEVLRLGDGALQWEWHSVLALRDLRSLDISSWRLHTCTTDILRTLATFPRLHTLRLHVRAVVGRPLPHPGGFQSLDYLSVRGNDSDVNLALRTIAPPRLRVLSLAGLGGFVAEPVLTRVCRRCASTLEEIHILDAEVEGVTLIDVLGPLFPAYNLRVFELDVSLSRVPFTDADLLTLAARWPALRRLDIKCSKGKLLPTLWGIADFADACPFLEEVHIECVAWPYIHGNDEHRRKNNLKRLGLRRPDNIKEIRRRSDLIPRTVARVVSRLFPALDIESSKEMIDANSSKAWGTFWGKALDETAKVHRAQRVLDRPA